MRALSWWWGVGGGEGELKPWQDAEADASFEINIYL